MRDNQITIRLDDDELAALQARAGREPLAAFIRRELAGETSRTSHRSEPQRATTPPSSTKSVQAERVQKIKELVNQPEEVPAIAKRRWA